MRKVLSMTSICFIGQSGVVVNQGGNSVVIEPHLSDSVARSFGIKFRRLLGVPDVSDWAPGLKSILLTHAHLDHTDTESIKLLLKHSPRATIYGPLECRTIVKRLRVAPTQVRVPHAQWFEVAVGIKARSVPAAHVDCEMDLDRRSRFVGYCLKVKGKLIYHAGATVLNPRVLHSVRTVGCPDIALIPVNQRNYYRDQQRIIRNLTAREALYFAQEIGAQTVIPIHWDMFLLNSTPPEEIRLLRSALAPELDVRILCCGESIEI